MTSSPEPAAQPAWTVDVFAARLTRGRERRLAATESTRAAPSPLTSRRLGLRLAAAVTGPFGPETFRPAGSEDQAAGAFELGFADDCVSLTDEAGRPRWILKPAVRRQTLGDLREPGEWLAALDANPDLDAGDPLRRTLRLLLQSPTHPLDLEALSALELTALLQIVDWGVPVPGELPAPAMLAAYRERKVLLAPFESLAGEHFVGRRNELRELRSFIDALSSEGALEALQRLGGRLERRLTGEAVGALVLQAPGGMGKSALIARFILDHTVNSPSSRLPFAYLDWEDPTLVAHETETMLGEIARQIALQHPGHEPLSAFITAVDESLRQYRLAAAEPSRSAQDLRSGRRGRADGAQTRSPAPRPASGLDAVYRARSERERERERKLLGFASELGDILGGLIVSSAEPLLLVLDTFERVQRYGLVEIEGIRRPLAVLQARCPALRVLIATRAPLPVFQLANRPSRMSVLPPLDRQAAAMLLERKGVDTADASRLAAHFGGSPLSLSLAARIYRRQGLSGVESISTRKWLIFSVSESEVQGRLYGRYLDQIEDLAVRRLAHPGLIVRRIDADVIFRVLAEPCGIALKDAGEARDLFERLKREITLVAPNSDGTDAVRHRADVRRLMLDLMRRDDPARADDIHRRAVTYYADLSDKAGPTGSAPWVRAEEIYHRLASGEAPEVVDARWVPGLAPYLQDAVDELPLRGKLFLASRIGAVLDDAEWDKASLDEMERHVESTVTRLIAAQQVEQALDVLAKQTQRSPGSRLYRLEAKALSLMGRSVEAQEKASAAIEAASWEGDKAGLAEMLFLSAELSYRHADLAEVPAVLERAIALSLELNDHARTISGLLLLKRTYATLGKPADDVLGRLAAALARRQAAAAPASRFEYEAVRLAMAELARAPGDWGEVRAESTFHGAEATESVQLPDDAGAPTPASEAAFEPDPSHQQGNVASTEGKADTEVSLDELFTSFNKGLSA